MPEITDERLAELRALADAATQAPWIVADTTDPRSVWYDEFDGPMLVTEDSVPGFYTAIAKDFYQGADDGRTDAKLAAAARNALPELLAEVERLRGEAEAARIVTTLYAWTGGPAETERGLALMQAWQDYAAVYGTPKRTAEWDHRIADLAARRRARKAEVATRLTEIVTTEEGPR